MKTIKKIAFAYGLPIVGRLFHKKNKFINVIYYHDIVDGKGYSFMRINFDIFKTQMEYIKSHGYKTLRFDDFKSDSDEDYDSKTILITFDDGAKSNYTKIYDLMKSFGLKYNIFLTASIIDNNPDFLTWDKVRLMHREGYVGFGIHTYTHPDMSDISKIDVNLELTKADEVFEVNLGYKPLDFCYPFGSFSEESNEYISSKYNYKRIYTSNLMYSYRQNEKLIFGRNGINSDEGFGVFKAKVKGYYNVWKFLFR